MTTCMLQAKSTLNHLKFMKYYKTITLLILFNMRKTCVGDKDHCIWPCFIVMCRLQQAWTLNYVRVQYVCTLPMAFLDMLRKRDC